MDNAKTCLGLMSGVSSTPFIVNTAAFPKVESLYRPSSLFVHQFGVLTIRDITSSTMLRIAVAFFTFLISLVDAKGITRKNSAASYSPILSRKVQCY